MGVKVQAHCGDYFGGFAFHRSPSRRSLPALKIKTYSPRAAPLRAARALQFIDDDDDDENPALPAPRVRPTRPAPPIPSARLNRIVELAEEEDDGANETAYFTPQGEIKILIKNLLWRLGTPKPKDKYDRVIEELKGKIN